MKKILKASAIVGSGSAAFIVAGIVKNKIIAVLLGPSGIGFFGLLQAVMNTAKTASGIGFASSGVRLVAQAQADGEGIRLALTRNAIWISSLGLGLFCALLLILFRAPIARLVGGNDNYSWAIALTGVGVLAASVSSAQTAFLNGLHRLTDLAKINIFSAISSMVLASIAVWLWRDKGIIVAVISIPVTSLFISSWFSRKIKTIKIRLSWNDMAGPLKKIFSLGFVLTATALMTVGTQFAVRVIITKTLGIAATGHFQAAWSISMVYLGFILGTMGTDYYPRLAAVSKDNEATNKLINAQAEVALLLAGPVILGVFTFAPQIISLLYTGAFAEAVSILRWQVIGDLFKVASWTIGFVMVAQGRSGIIFFTELLWNLIYVFLVWKGLNTWGIEAAGIAFLIAYFLYLVMIWAVIYRFNHFVWSRRNLTLMVTLVLCAALVSLARLFNEAVPAILGFALTLAMSLYSVKRISDSIGGFSWRRTAGR